MVETNSSLEGRGTNISMRVSIEDICRLWNYDAENTREAILTTDTVASTYAGKWSSFFFFKKKDWL